MDTIRKSQSTRTDMDTSMKATPAPPHSGPNESAASIPPVSSAAAAPGATIVSFFSGTSALNKGTGTNAITCVSYLRRVPSPDYWYRYRYRRSTRRSCGDAQRSSQRALGPVGSSRIANQYDCDKRRKPRCPARATSGRTTTRKLFSRSP